MGDRALMLQGNGGKDVSRYEQTKASEKAIKGVTRQDFKVNVSIP